MNWPIKKERVTTVIPFVESKSNRKNLNSLAGRWLFYLYGNLAECRWLSLVSQFMAVREVVSSESSMLRHRTIAPRN